MTLIINKSDREIQLLYDFSYMQNPKKKPKQMNKQNRNKSIYTENKFPKGRE